MKFNSTVLNKPKNVALISSDLIKKLALILKYHHVVNKAYTKMQIKLLFKKLIFLRFCTFINKCYVLQLY